MKSSYPQSPPSSPNIDSFQHHELQFNLIPGAYFNPSNAFAVLINSSHVVNLSFTIYA